MLASAAVLVLVLAPVTAGSASAQAVPSPTPTVGSANSPAPAPPGSTDSSPRDYKGAVWIVVGVVIVAALIGGGTMFLIRTRRIDLNPRSTRADEREAAESDRSSIGDQSATDHRR